MAPKSWRSTIVAAPLKVLDLVSRIELLKVTVTTQITKCQQELLKVKAHPETVVESTRRGRLREGANCRGDFACLYRI